MLKTTSERSGGRLLTYILNIMELKRTCLPPLGGDEKIIRFFRGGYYNLKVINKGITRIPFLFLPNNSFAWKPLWVYSFLVINSFSLNFTVFKSCGPFHPRIF